MPVKVTKSGIPEKIFKEVRDQFTRDGNGKKIRNAILADMKVGVSPVRGKKWKKYSNSYKSVIRGEKTFRTVEKTTAGEGFTVTGKKVKAFNRPDTEFLKHGKSISPVNLKLTGDLYKSLKVSTIGRVITIAFNSIIAVYHNTKGAGKKGNTRRMLPTKTGETLNEKIMRVVTSGVEKAVNTIVEKYNRR